MQLSDSERRAWEEYEAIRAALQGVTKKFTWNPDGEAVFFTPQERCYYSDILGRESWPNPFIRPLKLNETSDGEPK